MHLSRKSSDTSALWTSATESSNTNCEKAKLPDILQDFQKVPIVVLKRYNIDKYLRSNKSDISHKRFKLRECSVPLFRLELCDISISNTNKAEPYLKCDICYKIYYSQKKLENHKQIKHELCMVQVKTPKKVTFCDQVTVFEPQLYHKCRKCSSVFKNYTDLKSHTKHKHKKRRCYICQFCNKQFVDRMFFKVHIKLHCMTCGTLFEYKHESIAHRKLCMKPISIEDNKCKYCLQRFSSNCILKYHISVVHKKCKFSYNQLYASKMNKDSIEFICLFCQYISTEWSHFQSHVNTLFNSDKKISNESSNCNDYLNSDKKNPNESNCDTKFTEDKELIKQKKCQRVVLTDDPLRLCDHWTFYGSKFNKSIPCYLNPIVLVKRAHNLNNYFDKLYNVKVKKKRLKLDKSDHQCSVCKKYFTTSYVLRRHMSCVHFDFENNLCRDCNKSFDWPSQLINHECVHWKNDVVSKQCSNVVDLTDDVGGVNNVDFDDDAYDMMIPSPIVELTEYDNEYRFDNNGKMEIDNSSKSNESNNRENNNFNEHNYSNNRIIMINNRFSSNEHNYCNNNVVENKLMRINKDGKLVVSTLPHIPFPGLNIPHVMTLMAPYEINNHFITGDSHKFQAIQLNYLQDALCNRLPQSVMPPLIPIVPEVVVNTDNNGNL